MPRKVTEENSVAEVKEEVKEEKQEEMISMQQHNLIVTNLTTELTQYKNALALANRKYRNLMRCYQLLFDDYLINNKVE